MRVVIHPDSAAVARAVARLVADAVTANPRLVLGLPTGRTPQPMYKELIALHVDGAVDFSRVTTFNLDEFCGLAPDHPGSYRHYMEERFFRHVNLARTRIHFLRGDAIDPASECERYDYAILAAGGIDLQVLGLGVNGHIGFNEPAATLEPRTHVVELRPETRRANAALFRGETAAVPSRALSVGMATILTAREIVLLATGRPKAPAVRRMVSGPLDSRLPASFLLARGHVEVVLDQAAAEELPAALPPGVELEVAAPERARR